MEELRRMEELLASGSIEQLPVERMEQLLMKELMAARDALVPYFQAACARVRWRLQVPVLRSAVLLQARARAACVGCNIGSAIKQMASLRLARAGNAAAESYLQSSERLAPVSGADRQPPTLIASSTAALSPRSVRTAAVLAQARPAAPAAQRCDTKMHVTHGLSAAAGVRSRMQGLPQTCIRPRTQHLADADAEPAGPLHVLPVSPTMMMMQRARAARNRMPVYNSPPVQPSAAAASRSLQSAFAGSAHSGSIASTGSTPTTAALVQESSPSVIWVGPSGSGTPSEAATTSLAPAQALHQTPNAWSQLRESLEASLVARNDAMDKQREQMDKQREQQHTTRMKLEKEIALMQVRAADALSVIM